MSNYFMSHSKDCEFYLKELCRTCYEKKKHSNVVYQNGRRKCLKCEGTSSVYVNPSNFVEFVRDFHNSSSTYPNNGISVTKCDHKEKKSDHFSWCHFALNNFEYFVWDWMSREKVFKVEEMFKTYFKSFIYSQLPVTPLVTGRSSICETPQLFQHQWVNRIPNNFEENNQLKSDEKRKDYFCWFCFKTIKSEPMVNRHLSGEDHKRYYESDKKRRWFFKMPITKSLSLCSAKSEKCLCLSPHYDSELQEMNMRIRYRNFMSTYDYIHPTPTRLYPWPDFVRFSIPHFPVNIKCYKNPIKNYMCVKIENKNCKLNSVYLRDDHSRPFFKLLKCEESQELCHSQQLLKFNGNSIHRFGVEFSPNSSGTYYQTLEFEFRMNHVIVTCRRCIRVDLGNEPQLNEFLSLWEKYEDVVDGDDECISIVPFSTNVSDVNSLLTTDMLKDIFQVNPNSKWINTGVENYNYCSWMTDMMVLEELEQRKQLALFRYEGKMKLSDNVNFELTSFIPAKPGQLFGSIIFESGSSVDLKALNIITAYLIIAEGKDDDEKSLKLFECDVVDDFRYPTESRSICGITLNLSVNAVNSLRWVKNSIVNVSVLFKYNRQVFERRHKSIKKIPHYDGLAYNPLSCPFFTRLPYGDDVSKIKFKPMVNLNDQQQRLPNLVLRKINTEEVILPFVLNGAFGSGKSQVIAETVINIINNECTNSRILICTRSYSAGEVFLDKFEQYLPMNSKQLIKVIYSDYRKGKAVLKSCYRKYALYSSDVTPTIIHNNRVFISTLDNAVDTLSKLTNDFSNEEPMFHYVFVDEAAQVLEVDAIMVFQFGKRQTKFVFTGDVFQMRPEIYNEALKKFSLPIVSRLHKRYEICPDYEICLTEVFRTHPILVDYLANAIYCGASLTSRMTSPKSIYPMKFINSNYYGTVTEIFDNDFHSYRNESEVSLISIAIRSLLSRCPDISMSNVLVCTPFYAQVKALRKALRDNSMKDVSVDLPTAIQGREYDAVFISTVLTQNHVDKGLISGPTFHKSRKLINLVVSRSKHYVEVLGDRISLTSGPTGMEWRYFISMCESGNKPTNKYLQPVS